MKHFIKLACMSLGLISCVGLTKPQTQEYVEVSQDRVVYITSEIGANGVQIANKIMALAAKDPTRNIDLIINSPGGMILTGGLILQAMDMAQLRGVKFSCISSIYAASMAFSIFHHCNTRYAFPRTLLLFHPARLTGIDSVTGKEAEKIAQELIPLDSELLEDLKSMGMDEKKMTQAYYDEKFWTAKELAENTKEGYIILIRDIRGIPNPFAIGGL